MQYKRNYQNCEKVSDQIFQIVQFWTPFIQNILGRPFQNSIDLACINLAKAYQRKKGEKQIFIDFAKENLTESLIWLDKARRRKLVLKRDYLDLYKSLTNLRQKLLPKKISKTPSKPQK